MLLAFSSQFLDFANVFPAKVNFSASPYGQISTQRAQSRSSLAEQDTERLFRLETENMKLKKDLDDVMETVGILKGLIADRTIKAELKKRKITTE
jgi:hypothetical protein